MIKWTKPNGTKMETNDMKATIAYCKSLDWKQDKAEKVKADTKVKDEELKPIVEPVSLPKKQTIRAGKI